METILPLNGFVVLTAVGIDGLLQDYRDWHEEIDLVVITTLRFLEMDAPSILAALRRIDPAVRCGFMTGSPLPDVATTLIEHGALGVVAKPFRLDELLLALHEWTRPS
jgi:DNA-binding NtrC family response regulator